MSALYWITFFMEILFISATTLPSCKLSDSTCLKEVAKASLESLVTGIPDIGAETLDPLRLKKVRVDLAGLKLTIRDADIAGLSKSTIDQIKVDGDKKVLQIVYHTDTLMEGKYKASGQLLILPISGDGDMTFKLKQLEVQLTMPFEFSKNAEGKYVMDLKRFDLKYDIKGAHFNLTNLFNGNKELSDSMLSFMNQNWKILTEEFGLPMLEAAHKKIFDSIKKFLATQPIEDIAS